MEIKCPNCEEELDLPDSAVGKKVQCPFCAHVWVDTPAIVLSPVKKIHQGSPVLPVSLQAPVPPSSVSCSSRRVPIYLLVDVSASLPADAFRSMQNGIATLIDGLRENPLLLDDGFLSVVEIGGGARQVMPLSSLYDCELPKMEQHGACTLGAALQFVSSCWMSDRIPQTAEQKGDWRPYLFAFIGGSPEDDLREGFAAISAIKWSAKVFCAPQRVFESTAILKDMGDSADVAVVPLEGSTPATFDRFFRWVS